MALEHERTFLAKSLPADLKRSPSKEIIDIFMPTDARHPNLRIRKNGEKYEVTKKYPVKEGDATVQHEFTTPIIKEEFEEFSSSLAGKRSSKTRYYYKHGGKIFEFTVYHDALAGLVTIDVEFEDVGSMEAFVMPEFCLADVSQEEFLAGGLLAGKSYKYIEGQLARHGYNKFE
jgi:CYTH domain-containing protein